MRIIAGTHRGRRILSVGKHVPVRPILARIRQSMFDILRPKVPGARFLDLFAGTGAVGLEALSQGAGQVVFVEAHRTSLKVVEKNVKRLGFEERAVVRQGDATHALSWLLFHTAGGRFDLVFMGPPYVDKEKNALRLVEPVLKRLAEGAVLSEDAWVVAQHHKKEPFETPAPLKRFRIEKYGDSWLSFFRMPKGGKRIEVETRTVES